MFVHPSLTRVFFSNLTTFSLTGNLSLLFIPQALRTHCHVHGLAKIWKFYYILATYFLPNNIPPFSSPFIWTIQPHVRCRSLLTCYRTYVAFEANGVLWILNSFTFPGHLTPPKCELINHYDLHSSNPLIAQVDPSHKDTVSLCCLELIKILLFRSYIIHKSVKPHLLTL